MTEIMLIRRFAAPVGADYLHQASTELAWCRSLYGVTPDLHFIARDGLRCACIFNAPDAEAVRSVIRAGKRSEPEDVWACTVHPGADDDGRRDPSHPTHALVLVERTVEEPVAFEEILAIGERNIACFESHDARFVRSYFSADRRRMICLYHAPDAEAVRYANRIAGAPYDRVWPAQVLAPEMA